MGNITMLFREWSEADFPKPNVYHVVSFIARSGFPETPKFTLLFREWSEADFPKRQPK